MLFTINFLYKSPIQVEASSFKEAVIKLGADLSCANLRDANLVGANLVGANLVGADLSCADLSCADLYGADLVDANLHRANLVGADLRGANLRGANLVGANLVGANLQGANLRGANLRGANLPGANLRGANLRGGKQIIKLKETGTVYTSIQNIGSRKDTLQAFNCTDGIYVQTGCFGPKPITEFRSAVSKTHHGTRYADEYIAAIKLIEIIFKE